MSGDPIERIRVLAKILEIPEAYEFEAEKEMEAFGGLTIDTLKEVLGVEHPLFEGFDDEVRRLVDQGTLLTESYGGEELYVGNVTVEGERKERRPDKVILYLAKRRRFTSVLLGNDEYEEI